MEPEGIDNKRGANKINLFINIRTCHFKYTLHCSSTKKTSLDQVLMNNANEKKRLVIRPGKLFSHASNIRALCSYGHKMVGKMAKTSNVDFYA